MSVRDLPRSMLSSRSVGRVVRSSSVGFASPPCYISLELLPRFHLARACEYPAVAPVGCPKQKYCNASTYVWYTQSIPVILVTPNHMCYVRYSQSYRLHPLHLVTTVTYVTPSRVRYIRYT